MLITYSEEDDCFSGGVSVCVSVCQHKTEKILVDVTLQCHTMNSESG